MKSERKQLFKERAISKILCFTMILSLTITGICPDVAFGQTVMGSGSYLEQTQADRFISNDRINSNDDNDRIKITADGHFLSIDFANSAPAVEYRVSLAKPGYRKTLGHQPTHNGKFTATYYTGFVPNGTYYVLFNRARTYSQTVGNKYGDGGAFRIATVTINDGKVTIDKHDNIEKKNTELREYPYLNNPSWYLDPSLSDMDFVINDYQTKHVSALSEDEIAYIKNISDVITKDCQTDYDKAKAIYRYIGDHVYYDVYCNLNDYTKAYLNPYKNLRIIEEKLSAPNSNGQGGVATLCTGYSSLAISLMRAQGIPARLIYGYHLNTVKNTWDKAEGVETRSTHYWAEFYCDGKWMTCDAYKSSGNKWRRGTYEEPGHWDYTGFTNFGWLNPTEEQLAVTHYGQGVFTKTVLGDRNDIANLTNVLNVADEQGLANYEKIGLTAEDIDPEGNYIYLHNPALTYTQRKGSKLEKINWSDKDIYFDGKLKNFDGLKWVKLNNNPQLTYLSTSYNENLVSVFAKDCNIKTLYALGCPNLNYLYTEGNPLKFARYRFKGKTPTYTEDGLLASKVATVIAQGGGTIEVEYKKGKHTLLAKPDAGYKFDGWYDKSGRKMSKNEELKLYKNETFERQARFSKKIPIKKPPKKSIKKPAPTKNSDTKPVEKPAINAKNVEPLKPEENQTNESTIELDKVVK